jgi:hypothetical protein
MSSKSDEDSPDEGNNEDYYEAAKQLNQKLASIAKGKKAQKPPLPPRKVSQSSTSASSKTKPAPTAAVMMLASASSSSYTDAPASVLRKRSASSLSKESAEASDAIEEDVDSDDESNESETGLEKEGNEKDVENQAYRDAFIASIPTNSPSKSEIEKLIASDEKTININFYNLVVAAAGKSITRGDEVRTEFLHTKVHEEFFNIISLAPTKKAMWRDNLFVHLEKKTWPQCFTDYLEELKTETGNDASKLGKKCGEVLKLLRKQ